MRTERIVIAGAGPGGCAAAVQCARLGITPLLLDRTGMAGGLIANAWSMENYPGLEPISGADFVRRLQAHLERFEIEVEKAEVRAVGKAADKILLETDAGSIETEVAILAVGTLPRLLDLPGVDLFYEVRHLLERKPERALVIGGGEMAFDYALSLAGAGARVELLVRGGAPRARGRLAEFVAKEPRITIRLGTEAKAVLAGREAIVYDGIVVAIGRQSALAGIAGGLDLSPSGVISTPVPGLFVIGDARLGSLGQAGIAIGDGLEAAMQAVEYLDREDGC
jgi:thioredoxin reductase (NADPH)